MSIVEVVTHNELECEFWNMFGHITLPRCIAFIWLLLSTFDSLDQQPQQERRKVDIETHTNISTSHCQHSKEDTQSQMRHKVALSRTDIVSLVWLRFPIHEELEEKSRDLDHQGALQQWHFP